MKIWKHIGIFLIIIPVITQSVAIWALFRATDFASGFSDDRLAREMAQALAVNLYATIIGSLAFILGVSLQWFVAKKTEEYSRRIWLLMLIVGILFFPSSMAGVLIAGVFLVLLYNLQTFKKMRENRTCRLS